MIKINEKQVGGDHYRCVDYQHWDFVCDARLHYLIGCATKYISRWRKKNGLEDLNKALHYIEKADIKGIRGRDLKYHGPVCKFASQFKDKEIIFDICTGSYSLSKSAIKRLIQEHENTFR